MVDAEANMLFVEAPAGVGFSYSKNTSDYEGMNDERTGKNHHIVLWFFLVLEVEGKNYSLNLNVRKREV